MTERWSDIADAVRSRVRRLVLLRGLGWVLAVTVGVIWLAGLVDWSVHLDAAWTRLVLLIALIGTFLAVAWRMLIQPLLVQLSDVDVARILERRLPQSADGLSSAAQFRSMQEDQSLGSAALQRVTIERADESVQGFDLEGVFSLTSGRRAILAAAIAMTIALATVIAAPGEASTALQRLAMPLADISWPRTTKLRLLDTALAPLGDAPLRTTEGESLSVYVENELGSLPEDLTLEVRLPDETEQQQMLRTTLLRDVSGAAHEVGIVSLTAYRGPLRFRVFGGDDKGTEWRMVDVVAAPSLERLVITLTPPAYTDREPRTIDGAGFIEGLVGSRVSIKGESSESLESVTLHREGQPPQLLPLSDENRRFGCDFVIAEPGQSWYWFELLDEHGLPEPEPPRYELRGIADRPPVVYIDKPATDLTVTPVAEVPLSVIARDDWGLRELRLRLMDTPVGETAAQDDLSASITPDGQTVPLPLSVKGSVEETLETVWQLAPLSLSPGATLTYWVEAVDACDLATDHGEDAGQVGASSQRRLHVVTESNKQRELAARQSGILNTLEALRDRQAKTHDMTAQLRIQAELAQQLRPADIDLLKQAELAQRDIRRQIADEASGLSAEVAGIERELQANKIDDPEAAQRLALLADDLGELDKRLLPSIEQALARARKSTAASAAENSSEFATENEADDASGANQRTSKQLRDAEDAQESALTVLADAAKLLGGWRKRFQIRSELDGLVADQRRVQEQTKEIGRETLARAASRLSAQQQADLARLSDRQRRLATRMEQLLETPAKSDRPQESGDLLKKAEPEVDSPELQEAQAWLRQQGTAGEMHQAAESLKRNEIPAAAQAQENVLAALRRFGEQLNQSPLNDPANLLSELHDAREQVEMLRKEQQTLAQSSQQAIGPTADPSREEQLQRLRKRQSDLAEDTEETARQLKRQQQQEVARTASRAAQRMRDAQEALEQQLPAEIAINQQEALDDLEQLANELADLQWQAEAHAAQQRLQQLAGELRTLSDGQQALSEKTSDLNTRQEERGSWSRSLRRELRDLIERQRELKVQLDEQKSFVDELPVVSAALMISGDAMNRAAELLDRQEAGAPTAAAQEEARQRLLSVAEVLGDSNGGGGETAARNEPTSDAGEQTPATTETHLAAQLKLLRQMQADVNRRTLQLANTGEGDGSPPAIQDAKLQIAREQSRIAELTKTLLQVTVDAQGPAEIREESE